MKKNYITFIKMGSIISFFYSNNERQIDQDLTNQINHAPNIVVPLRIPIRPMAIIEPVSRDVNILVVDDAEVLVSITTKIINKLNGYNALGLLDANSALDNIKEKWMNYKTQYDIIIIDIDMPDINGYQLAKEIRNMEIIYNMRKHLLIGLFSKNVIDNNDNFNHIVNKPFTLSTLMDIVRTLEL